MVLAAVQSLDPENRAQFEDVEKRAKHAMDIAEQIAIEEAQELGKKK